ncbi:MAG: hypothetical protein ACTSWN_06750 [Promethearchaeota archaeon]
MIITFLTPNLKNDQEKINIIFDKHDFQPRALESCMLVKKRANKTPAKVDNQDQKHQDNYSMHTSNLQ